MNPDDDIPESVRSTLEAMQGRKEESYGLVGRIIMFVVVIGLGSALAFGLWIRFAMGAAMSAGNGTSGSPLGLIPFLWVAGVIATAIMTFKK